MKNKITWSLQKRKLSQLNPYEHNPRKLTDKGMTDLKKSIDKFGLAEPIIINQDNTIVGGHARFFTLLKNNDSETTFVDCYVPNIKLTPKEVQELNIRLNKNIAGEFDFDILSNEFELDDLLEWGFEEKELDRGLWDDKTEEQLDEVPEVQKVAISKPGDLFLLDGKHRVMCGDSTKKEDVEKLMDGQKADMVFTDPPYGMFLDAEGFDKMPTAKGTTHKGYSNIIGDAEDFKDDFINNIFACFGYCKEIFLWGADYYTELLPNKNNGSWIVWDKRQEGGLDKLFGSCFELCWSKQKHKREIARILWAGYFGMSGTDTKERVHPTQKPVELVAWFFNKYGKENQSIVDLFGGSGSTLIACEQTNRICYGMELDPIYIDVILRRYYNLYPEKRIECLTRNDFNFSDLFKTDAEN